MAGRNNFNISKLVLTLVCTALVFISGAGMAGAETSVSGRISTNTTWSLAGSPYIVIGDVFVYNSPAPTLTIEPGVVVKFNQGFQLRIGYGSSNGGKLFADNVLFTGSSQTKGWWGGIYFDQKSDGSMINNSRIEYGGYGNNNANFYLGWASVSISNSIITNSSGYGIYSFLYWDNINIINNEISNNTNHGLFTQSSGGSITLKDNRISNNSYGAYFDGNSYNSLIVENNTFNGNKNFPLTINARNINGTKGNAFTSNTPNEIQLLAGTINSNSTMREIGAPFNVTGEIIVYDTLSTTPTLTIEPGVVVKFNQGYRLRIGYSSGSAYGGKLIADNVVFTGTSPVRGWWSGIYFDGKSDGSEINNSRIEYGGYGNNANINLYGASVSISNNIITNSSGYGIYSNGYWDNVDIIKSVIKNNGYGVYITGSYSAIQITDNTVFNNSNGVYLTGASNVKVYHNRFINNTVQAFDNALNTWDNGYPGGGNVWSNYTGLDMFSGAGQDIPGSDGIGDIPYNISGGSRKDRYPLIASAEFNEDADYELKDIAFEGVLSEGGTVKITATVKNLGPNNITTGSMVGFYVDRVFLEKNTIPGLDTNGSANTTIIWNAGPGSAGHHNVKAIADIDNIITETDEGNNEKIAGFDITPDTSDPEFISITRSPANITEFTIGPVTIEANITDSGVGIDPASVKIFYTAGIDRNQTMSNIGGGKYRAIISENWNSLTGTVFSYFINVSDRVGNINTSQVFIEYIEGVNDIPVITIYNPDSSSQWGGVNHIRFNVDNDGEGPVNTTIYFWQAFDYAPGFEENPVEYFRLGNWIKIADVANASEYSWDTAGLNGFTKINLTTSDGIYTVSKLSDVFIIDNTNPGIRIDNFAITDSFLTKPAAEIIGEVDAVFGTISGIYINDTRFDLALDPKGKIRSGFRFTSNVDIPENFTVLINATDTGGNYVEVEASFIIDNTPPVINNISFVDAFTSDFTSIIVNATDDIGIQGVKADMIFNSIMLDQVNGIYKGIFTAPSVPGTYPVNVTVTDHANNTVSGSVDLIISEGTDLTLYQQDISFDPGTILTGQKVNVSALIRNVGDKSANNVNITFRANNIIAGRDIINITDTAIAKTRWDTTGFAGNITFSITIENSSGVVESNYVNNNASRDIFIDGPDLTVNSIIFNPPSPVYEGQVVTITANIRNLKPVDANNVRITFYANEINISKRIDLRDVNVLAGGSVDVSVEWQTAGMMGENIIFVEANTGRLPSEVDFSNNILNGTFYTKKYIAEQIPDLLTFPKRSLPSITQEKIRGMASNDFNKDNRTDFVAGTDKGKIILYRNTGVYYSNENKIWNVNFTQILIDDIGEAAWGMTSADLFGDGYPDIIAGTESGKIIFYNNSNGVFVNNITLLDVGDWAYGLAATDLNNDNKFDLVIGNKLGQVNLYINNMTSNTLTNQSMVFDRILTTKDLPFGITTGDYDLDGHIDVMVGDRLGQVERIVYEIDKYNGFLFADIGALAYGLTTADMDFSGKLDLLSIGFDGNISMFFSREGGLVAEPLIIGNIPESYGLTSGDYDSDNDIDVIVGSDNGNVTMLMNSLRIIKSSTPSPSPPGRNIEVETLIQNPWAGEMAGLNITESWRDDLSFVENAYAVCTSMGDGGQCYEFFYADMFFFGTPRDTDAQKYNYYIKFPSTICKKRVNYYECNTFEYNGEAKLQEGYFNISNVPGIFEGLDVLRLREGFKFKYKLNPESVTNVSAITIVNYTLLGSFNTPNTDFMLSDDVTNLNNIIANTRNINQARTKTDMGYTDNLIIAPDFTITKIDFSGYSYPPVPGEQITVTATIKNLNNIGINNIKVMFLVDNEPVDFCSINNCRNYTTFDIGPLGTKTVSKSTNLPSSINSNVNFTVIANPLRDEIETDYDNNDLTASLSSFPPSDLKNDIVFFSNGTHIKNVFVEGEKITVFTNITNIGINRSFSEDVYFPGFDVDYGKYGKYEGIVPKDQIVDCSEDSDHYDRDLCDGYIMLGTYDIPQLKPHTSPGNIDPGNSVSTNMSGYLGDFKVRSFGTYNFTTIITNQGSTDDNHGNDANFGQFIVLPGQEDLQFDYDYHGVNKIIYPVESNNSVENNITFMYREMNIGGYDISNYDSIVYLDNNDSIIIARIENESLANHTSDVNTLSINWSLIPPGDHRVNFYLDYGKNTSESTARAVSNDGLIFIADEQGVSGNELSVSIQNITQDAFRVNITKKKEIVEQTAFDLLIRTETETISYDKQSGNSDIMTVGDIVDVIRNGGYSSGQFIPSGWLKVEINGADIAAKPAVQTLTLAVPGSFPNERYDSNNELNTIFRWKEVKAGPITFSPQFPAARDVIAISSSISNEGDIRTGPFNVSLYIDGELKGTKTISLFQNEIKPVTFSFTLPSSKKMALNAKIIADTDNIITHEDESNNIAATSIPLSAPFELNILSREQNINFLSSYINNGIEFLPTTWDFGNISMEYDAYPEFEDYDGDGDLDMVIGSLDGRIQSFENIGTVNAPIWKETDWQDHEWRSGEVPAVNVNGRNYDTFDLSTLDVGARSVPEFADLDNDSLNDLVIGDTHGRLHSYKRVIAEKYEYVSGQYRLINKKTWVEYDFNLSKVSGLLQIVPRFADLDGDGDLDLIVGSYSRQLKGYENIGNKTHPDWNETDFNLSQINVGTSAAALDIKDMDSDGDVDIIIGDNENISIYKNIGGIYSLSWQETAISISIPGKKNFKPILADLDNDGDFDLVSGSNDPSRLKLRKGYYEPVNVQIINYANNIVDISRIELSILNASSSNKITDLLTDGPFGQLVQESGGYGCNAIDLISRGHRIGSQGVIEKEYDINIPFDLPGNVILGLRASKQENLNPSYFYELGKDDCGDYTYKGGEKGSPVYINRPELGGNTFDLFVDPGTTYEYKGSYRVYHNGIMSEEYNCIQNWCPIYSLTEGEINTIVGSGEIRRYEHISRNDIDIVKPEEPPILLRIDNKFGLELKPGYIEDIEISVLNNNNRAYTIDRIALELFDQGKQTGQTTLGNDTFNITVPAFEESRIINLFTDTSGFTLPSRNSSTRKYKIYIPEGIPEKATLLVKGIEKYSFGDDEYDRSNIKELWPGQSDIGDSGGKVFSEDLVLSNIYNNTNITSITDPAYWGHQDFEFGNGCYDPGKDTSLCGPEESFLRKQIWVPGSIIKSEYKQVVSQFCTDFKIEPASGITTWINGKLRSSFVTDCEPPYNNIRFGWTPNYDQLIPGANNEIDLYSTGPERQFDITSYDMSAFDYMQRVIVNPSQEAFGLNITQIGNNGLLRRQYEEIVNITVANNDDDPIKVDVVTVDLITPQNKKIHLLTDTKPRSIPAGSKINISYIIFIPADVPLNSRLVVQAEKVFKFPDKLWNRNSEISLAELLNNKTIDYHWGDTEPTNESSNYRKHLFIPGDVTRAEMILGDTTFKTTAYLNGELQGYGYPGWSPISVSSGLKQGEENLLSVVGQIPYTDSRIYSGRIGSGGSVIEPEEDMFFAVFGVREKQNMTGREPFFVSPGEEITARIRVDNKYNKSLDFSMKLSVVDLQNLNEIPLKLQTLSIQPFEKKYLEVDLVIPDTISNEARLQLSFIWNEKLNDKNWLRGSNFQDNTANNKFLDDSQWGVVEVGADNERATYFRKHMWVDSTVQAIKILKTGVDKMWVNGLEVSGNTLKNEFTKSESNLITLKASNFDIDADIYLDHFVPVRSTDIDSIDQDYSSMLILSQNNTIYKDQSSYDCSNQTLGECIYKVNKGEMITLNFTLRNAGELFARDFNLTVLARNPDTGEITEFDRERITMHPFSTDTWNVSWNTNKLKGGFYEFIVFPDANDDIIETSEYNNQITRKVYVNARPEIKYLESSELTGYNENVSIKAGIFDEDGNIRNISLNLREPDTSQRYLNVEPSEDIYSSTFNDTKQGRYRLGIEAFDAMEENAKDNGFFDIFDSIYLNVKTEKNVYFYTQKVRLTPTKLSNLTKQAINNAPLLFDAFDNVDRIKGGDMIRIRTNAYDPDGDLLALYVCKSDQADAGGCEGGDSKTYCKSRDPVNPTCSFDAERDNIKHQWFAFVVDKYGLLDGPIPGNYITDSIPPVTRLHSIASDRTNLIDTQNDSKTIVTIEGEPGMSCRSGKDPEYRFHKDRSYSFLEKDCSSSGGFASCNLGDIKKNDPAMDRVTNLTRAYVSCVDDLGNEQNTLENIDIMFGVQPVDNVFDDYQGEIIVPDSQVNMFGETRYCIDKTGTCMPKIPIKDSPIIFDLPGVFHLRYSGNDSNVKETTVIINSKPNISEQKFSDILGEHAFDVSVKVSDPDDQDISCELDTGMSIIEMTVENGIGTATLKGNSSESINTQVRCSDGFETVFTAQNSHRFPNLVPMLRNIPDISLEPGQNTSFDMGYFGFDLENDTLAYSMVSQDNPELADVNVNSNNLSVYGKNVGKSYVCLKANDGQSDSNVQCISIIIEDGSGSYLKNNEFAQTSIRLLMQIQYFDGMWQDEFITETRLNVLPGANNQIDLGKLFEWNTSTSSHPEGLFRVIFKAVDDDNNILINRDGTQIIDHYNFTMVLFNTPPNISGIPDKIIFENEPSVNIDLLDYTSDNEQNIKDLHYAIDNQANSDIVNCSITNVYIISCIPARNKTGISEINVSVFDGFAYAHRSFSIRIIPYEEFISRGNVTYEFISDQFDVSGDSASGFRRVSVNDAPPGRYNITVIVSYGSVSISRNITVTLTLPGTPVLDNIGNRTTGENQTLSIQLAGYDPDGKDITFGTDAGEKLPGIVLFNKISGSFEWTPGFDDSGNYSVTFNASNGNFNATETINITVLNTNRPPILDLIADITVNESEPVSIITNFSDPDNENSVTNDDNDLTIFIDDIRYIKEGTNFTWQTDCQDSGNYSVNITFGDGYLTDTRQANITVLGGSSCQQVNRPPVAYDQTVSIYENTQDDIDLAAFDPDAEPISFAIVTGPMHGTLSGSLPNLTYMPVSGYNGTDSFTFNASDGKKYSNLAIVYIEIIKDTIDPTIDSLTIYPVNTTAGSTINISLKASDTTGIIKVTANDIILKNSGDQWLGSITAPSVLGKASVTIKVIDGAGNTAERSVNYSVVSRVGGIAITSIPKPLSIVRGSSGQLNIKLISTANIDDRVWVNITTTGISPTTAIDLAWFNRTSVPVEVPSKATVYVPFGVTVPSDAGIGYKTFKNNAKSLGFNATSVDTGMVNVRS